MTFIQGNFLSPYFTQLGDLENSTPSMGWVFCDKLRKGPFLVQIIGGILDLVMGILKIGNTAICFGQEIEEWP